MAEPLAALFAIALADAPIVGRPLSAWQAEACEGIADLNLGPGVLATAAFAQALVSASEDIPGPTTPVVPLGPLHDAFGPNSLGAERDDGGLAYAITLGDQTGDPTPVVVPAASSGVSRAQPGRMAQGLIAPRGDRMVWGIGHWADLLVANLTALQVTLAGVTENRVEDGAAVHPTAVIERSHLGSGVQVGPHAVVRNSVIGAGTSLEEHTSVARSVIGPDCVVQTAALVHDSVVGDTTVASFHTATRGSLLLGHSTISAPVVARSVVGRDVFLARGVQIGASTLNDQPIRVRIGRRSIDTGIRLLGAAIGSGARIGGGIALPPGHEVPAGTYLVERPLPRLDPEGPRHVPIMPVERGFRQVGLASGVRSRPSGADAD